MPVRKRAKSLCALADMKDICTIQRNKALMFLQVWLDIIQTAKSFKTGYLKKYRSIAFGSGPESRMVQIFRPAVG